MDFKPLLMPTKWKVATLVITLLIFGVPATFHTCSTYPLMPGQSPPPCVEYMTAANVLTYIFLISPGATDVANSFVFNPAIVLIYLIALYLVLSLVFYAARKK